MLSSKKTLQILKNIILVNFLLLIIFGRSFSGIYILGFRIGEIIVGLLLIISVSLIFLNYKNKFLLSDLKITFSLFQLIVIFFLISLFVNNGKLLNTYTYKSSSYIWFISLYFLFYIFKKNNIKLIEFQKYLPYILIIVYIFSTIYYPSIIKEFFSNYSDKFEFLKASDILLIYIFTNSSNLIKFNSKLNSLAFLFISSSILIPLFLYMSKGSFFPALLYFIVVLFLNRNTIKRFKLKTIFLVIVSSILFIASTFEVYGNLTFEKKVLSSDEENISTILSFTDNLNSIANQKNTTTLFGSFYFQEQRLYSKDLMLNWRLQIWQDILYESIQNNEILLGQGYNSMIRVMDHPERIGTDGTNENVHNYFVNIFARGGLFQLFLFSFLIFYFCKNIDIENRKLAIISLLCIYLTSSFDANMESVRFPFVFYILLFTIFNINKSNKVSS